MGSTGSQIQESVRRIDDHFTGGEIDFFYHLLNGRNKVLFSRSLDDIKHSPWNTHDSCDGADPFTSEVVNFQADGLVVIVLTGPRRFEIAFFHAQSETNPFFRLLKPVGSAQLDEPALPVSFAGLDFARPILPVFFKNNLLE